MKKLTTEEFVSRAKSVHNDLYDYTRTQYTRSRDTVKIFCKECSRDFVQVAGDHLTGRGCPSCASERRSNSNKTHGLSGHPIHQLWSRIQTKCNKGTATMCVEWLDFETFYEFCIKNDWFKGAHIYLGVSEGYGTGSYCPDNVKFITLQELTTERFSGEYSFKSPDGVLHTTDNLYSFAYENNLSQSGLSDLARGARSSHKGWVLP